MTDRHSAALPAASRQAPDWSGAAALGLLVLASWLVGPEAAQAEFRCPATTVVLLEPDDEASPQEWRDPPCLNANVYFEAQGVQRLSGDGDNRTGYAFASSTFSLVLTERLAAELGLALGAADDEARTRALALVGDYAVRASAARLRYSHGPLGLHIGAYSPEPGLRTEFVPGMLTAYFADDYYLETAVGAGAAWTMSDVANLQSVHFTADAFATDQLVAGEDVEDWFVVPPSADNVLGHDYASVLGTAAAVYATDLVNIRSRGAVVFQSGASATLPDQLGVSVGLAVDVPLGAGWTLKAAAEAAGFRATGPVDHVRGYVAAGVAAAYRSWEAALGYAVRERDVRSASQGAQRDRLVQASLAYYLPRDITIQFGYRHITEYSQPRHEVGVRVTWEAMFGLL